MNVFEKVKNWSLIKKIMAIILLLFTAFIIYLFLPSVSPAYKSLTPITDYQIAVDKFNEEVQQDSDLVSDHCKSIFLTHEEKTENVIVFFHGYTSCPGQFKELGEVMYNEGYNVYIPRAPYHGYKDKATREIDNFTTQEYVDYAETSIQIAHGFGNKVYVSGLSGGANLASWIAINDSSIEKAIVLSPGYGFKAIPLSMTTPASKLFMLLPSYYVYYNENDKQGDPKSDVYAGYTTKSLANVLRIGQVTYDDLMKLQVSSKKIAFVINENDDSISVEAFNNVKVALESNTVGIDFDSYTFPKSVGLGHDYLDPAWNGSTKESSYAEIKKVILK
jgi:esterase/lipase